MAEFLHIRATTNMGQTCPDILAGFKVGVSRLGNGEWRRERENRSTGYGREGEGGKGERGRGEKDRKG